MEAMGDWNDDDDDGDNLVGALLDIIAVSLEMLLLVVIMFEISGSWCRRNRVQAYLAFTTASKMAAALVFAFVISNGIVGIDDNGDDECSDVSWRRFKLVKCEQVARELLMGARRGQAEKAVEE